MYGHHLQFHLVPTGHPGEGREHAPNGVGNPEKIFRRATAEAVLLRARLREHERHRGCDRPLCQEAA
jgi:hypothetical protein